MKAWQAVMSSLIAGYDGQADDEAATNNPDEYRHFCCRLLDAFGSKGADEFDKWLRVESGQGFVRLFPAYHKLGAGDKSQAKLLTRRFFRLQMYAAYQTMARCFGALMLVIWCDFHKDPSLSPSTEESQLFRQINRPQFYLGGLPLAFFSPPQLRWFLRPLLDLWGQERFQPEDYDALTKLLGLYGEIARSRREADREIKARSLRAENCREEMRRSSAAESGRTPQEDEVVWERDRDSASSAQPDQATIARVPCLDRPESFPELLPPGNCERCKKKLQWSGDWSRTPSGWLLMEVKCEDCDEDFWSARIYPEKWPEYRRIFSSAMAQRQIRG
jgi:hypothetical protein